jgi:hypothetical protein
MSTEATQSAKAGATVGGVFISYSSTDRPIVSAAARLLRAGGATVFQDVIDIEFGTRWKDSLFEALARCERVMVFWSAAAAKSEWVEREWRSALEAKKRIVPMILDDTPLPTPLSEFHGVPHMVDMLRAAMLVTAAEDAGRVSALAARAPRRLYAALCGLGATVVAMGGWIALRLSEVPQADPSRGGPDGTANVSAELPVFIWAVSAGLVGLLMLSGVLLIRHLQLRATQRDAASGAEPQDGLSTEDWVIGRRFTAAIFDEPINPEEPSL